MTPLESAPCPQPTCNRKKHWLIAATAFAIGIATQKILDTPNPISTTSPTTPMTSPITSITDASVKKYDIDGGICYLYPDAPNAPLSAAYVIQDGRYPTENFKMNKKCTEAFFIIDGEYTLTLGHETRTLKAQDVVYIPVNTPYAMEGKGTSFVYITPQWESSQNVHCDQDGNELPKPE
jgi:mannose-6-phosphate isomerase-like protein (cupin superfamily)